MTGTPGQDRAATGAAARPGGNAGAAEAADRLRGVLEGLLGGLPAKQLSAAVERLMTHYRGRTPTDAPVLRSRADSLAYAAYRMPATCRAAGAALAALAARLPGWTPESHLDIGGGTGAAVWAASGVWPGDRRVTVLDWAGSALDLGRELADAAAAPEIRGTAWHRGRIGGGQQPEFPRAGLVTISYLLGELPAEALDPLVGAAAQSAPAVVVVEPGTPEGYRRILRARDRLAAAGMRVLAPCPHTAACPMAVGDDWCHFAARVSRSALHRRVKGGELPYEDEKYSYVAAVHPDLEVPVRPATAAAPGSTLPTVAEPKPKGPDGREAGGGAERPEPAPGRIVRHPQHRKGHVLLEVCSRDDGLRRDTVTKRDRDRYRAARNATWGDSWE